MIASPRIVGPRKLHVLQGSPEWLAARREHITATDIPILLGLSPYKCEQDLADEKLGLREPTESTIRMRIGKALEDLIADAYAEKKGVKVRRVRGLWESATIPWAAASPDATAPGQLIELKWSGSRSRFGDELPQDIEAQVAWQMLVAESPTADVATLTVGDDDIKVYPVRRNPAMEDKLVRIAEDFRRRLDAGGPFEQSNESLKRRYPRDNGAEIMADSELTAMVRHLMALRVQKEEVKKEEESEEAAIKGRMGEIATVRGTGWHVTWKRSKDRTETNYKALAMSLLSLVPEADREAVVGLYTTVGEGFRPFRVWED